MKKTDWTNIIIGFFATSAVLLMGTLLIIYKLIAMLLG